LGAASIWWALQGSSWIVGMIIGMIKAHSILGRMAHRPSWSEQPAMPGLAAHQDWAHTGAGSPMPRRHCCTNLDAINARLRSEGRRETDPNDDTLKERYGL
jgi:hypothetical protein